MEDVHERNTGLLIGLIFCALILIARISYLFLADTLRFPIKTVKIIAPYHYIARKQLEEVLSIYSDKSFFTISSAHLRKDLLALPWSKEVAVMRIWPDTLKITLVEKLPVAIWNASLLTEAGEMFEMGEQDIDLSLPILTGPENQQLKVLQIYQKLSKLLTKHNLYASSLHFENQTWELSLSNGIQLYLGKQDLEQRVERFCKAYSVVFADRQSCIVDLRYARGMAIRWNQ